MIRKLAHDEGWLASVTPEVRRGIMGKLLKALSGANPDDVHGQRMIVSACRALAAFERNDLEVASMSMGGKGVVNNTQINMLINGRELPEFTRDDLLAIRKFARDAQAQAGQGGEAGAQERPDGHACEDS